MINQRLMEQTMDRYQQRTIVREATETSISAGDLVEANDIEQLRKRMERKGIDPTAIEGLKESAGASEGFAALPADELKTLDVLERIVGTNDLTEAYFLIAGARATRSVCRIVTEDPGTPGTSYGTGVLVSEQLLMTNNHVLPTSEWAANSQAEFDYEETLGGELLSSVRFALDPERFYLTDIDLDYTLVAVSPRSQSGKPLTNYGSITLIEATGKVIKGECVNIIQHPNGEPKQVALRENLIVDILEQFLHYKTDTAPGSSGSPVFNDEWELVALHHSGVPARDSSGEILAIDGSLWTDDMGEHRVKWIANEGVRISRIINHARSQQLDAARSQLLGSAIDVTESSGLGIAAGHGPWDHAPTRTKPVNTSPATQAQPEPPGTDSRVLQDGAATWTIPLTVTVQIGTPSLSTASAESPSPTTTIVSPTTAAQTVTDQINSEILAEVERGRRLPYFDPDADSLARDEYYKDVDRDLSRTQLFNALSELLTRTHTGQPRYEPRKHVYPFVDLHPNRKLRSIYTGKEYEPEDFIREDLRIENERTAKLQERMRSESGGQLQLEEALNMLESQLPYNCEHVVPQSWFEKREPMRGDIHHLFACESGCNSFRSNIPYFEFEQFDEALREGCGMTEGNRFEPSHGKGPAARAVLYFFLRYPGEINRTAQEYEADRLPVLLEWHRQDPVGLYERHRNAAIFARQGNRNPLIDFPDWAAEINFARGLGD